MPEPLAIAIKRMDTECRTCGKTFSGFAGKWHCDPCIEKRDSLEHQEKIQRRIDDMIFFGAIQKSTTECTFAKSDLLKESSNADAYVRLRKWTYKSCESIWICGPKGVGKSFIARCCLNEAIAQGASAIECTGFGFSSKCLSDHKRYFSPSVMLIDDIDKGHWSDIAASALWDVLENRKGVVIVTSNYTASDFVRNTRDRLTNSSVMEAAVDRLKPCVGIQMQGKSFR